MNEEEPLETHLLETFVELVRQGSVTGAAERLNRSQPAISHRLRAIEERFDVPLFEKVGRRLELTEYGERLFEQSLDLLVQLEGLHEKVVGPADSVRGKVTVGTFPTVARHLLLDTIEELLSTYEYLRLNFRFATAAEQIELLRTGRVDMLVFVGDIDATALEVARLGETKLVAAMAPEQAPAGADLEIAHLQNSRYLAWSGPSDPTFDAAYRYAVRHGLRDARTPEVPHIEALRALTRRGVGYSILPGYTTFRDVEAERLKTFSLPDFDQVIPIALVTRARQDVGPTLRTVTEAIAATTGELL